VEFEEQTGIALDVRIVPSDLYFSNKIHHLLEGEDAADVYMSGPVLVWEHWLRASDRIGHARRTLCTDRGAAPRSSTVLRLRDLHHGGT
jgi:hypothetical protein